MCSVKVERKYGAENFSKLFNLLIDEKVNSIRIKIKEEREARYNNIIYPSTNNEVDKVE